MNRTRERITWYNADAHPDAKQFDKGYPMERDWIYLIVIAGLLLTQIATYAARLRARATTRWQSALDAYANRQIHEERRRRAARNGEVLSVA